MKTAIKTFSLPLFAAAIAFGAFVGTASAEDAMKPDCPAGKTCEDTMKPDAMKPDAMKPDAMKPDAMKPDAMKPDAMKPDAMAPAK